MFANATLRLHLRSFRLHLLAFILVLFCGGFNAHAQTPTHTWLPANNGISGAAVNAFGLTANGDILIGTPVGMFILPKNAKEWKTTPIKNWVFSISRTPANTLLTATTTGTYRSTNNGQDWTQTFATPGQQHFSYGPDGTVHATQARSNGVAYRYSTSSDDGRSWQTMPLVDSLTYDPWVVENQEGHLFMTGRFGLYLSKDDGKTWETTNYTALTTSAHVLPNNNLLVTGYDGLWESADEGNTWQQLDTLNYDIHHIAPNGDYYAEYASSGKKDEPITPGLYHFTENGSTKSLLFPSTNVRTMSRQPDGTLWISDKVNVLQSSDNGETWRSMITELANVVVTKLLTTTTDDMFALADAGGESSYSLFRSTNNGQSWQFLRDSLDPDVLLATKNGHLFATEPHRSWKYDHSNKDFDLEISHILVHSTDRGETWQEVLGNGTVTSIASNPNGSIAVGFSYRTYIPGALTGDIGVLHEGDTAWQFVDSWRKLHSGSVQSEPQAVNTVAMLDDNSVLFSVHKWGDTGFEKGGLFRLNPDGTIDTIRADFFVQAMERTPDGNLIADVLVQVPTDPVYAADFSDPGIYRSTDNGNSWTMVHSLDNSQYYYSHQSLLAFGPNGQAFFSSWNYSWDESIHRSTDYGATWSQVHITNSDSPLSDFSFHPDGSIFSRNHQSVLFSENNGETWVPVINGFPNPSNPNASYIGSPRTLALSPNGQIFCGTHSYGIYKLDYTTSVKESRVERSSESLHVVASNNPTAQFTLQQAGTVSLKLYDIIGREVLTILNEHRNAGEHQIQFSPSELVTGTYLLVLTTEQLTESVRFYR